MKENQTETTQSEALKSLAQKLKAAASPSPTMILGLDGFVDEIIHLVDTRHDFDTFDRIKTIAEFGARVTKAAGLSANFEMVPQRVKLGGNGPIMANALLSYGSKLTYIGAIGDPDIHPVFRDMAERCQAVYSLCDPGHTDALEFEDGKLMMGKIAVVNQITWERFKEVVGPAATIAGMIENSTLFGMENWTMIAHMSDVWEGIINEVFPLLPDRADKPLAFFDLADPEKRTKSDILRAMGLIGKFEKKFKTILGLNKKELYEIAKVFNLDVKNEEPIEQTIRRVYDKLGIYCLLVHPTHEAYACANGEISHVDGPYTSKPVLTTGAGDNFNAGFCFGQALGLTTRESLLLGTATSGFYVRNAQSPTLAYVIAFMESWAEGKV
jgi:hypothetical protein